MHPKLIPVTSSNIVGYAYDATKQKLIIAFHNGTHYLYENVPVNVVESFKQASSKGRYFNANIRNSFSFLQLDVDEVIVLLQGVPCAAPEATPKKHKRKRSDLERLAQRYPFLRASF